MVIAAGPHIAPVSGKLAHTATPRSTRDRAAERRTGAKVIAVAMAWVKSKFRRAWTSHPATIHGTKLGGPPYHFDDMATYESPVYLRRIVAVSPSAMA